MKKTLFSLCLAGLMAGCAANDPAMDGNKNGSTDAEVKGYLSINLVTTGAPSSRADDPDPSDPTDTPVNPNNGQYEYGTPSENYVQEVRFFFFYSEEGQRGLPCPIRKNPMYMAPENGTGGDNPEVDQNGQLEYFSYYDWSPTYSDNQNYEGSAGDVVTEPSGPGSLGENATIEKVLTVMVVLTSKQGYAPDQVVAIINPTPTIKALQNPSLAQLQAANMVADYQTGLTDNNFVMSNSVYVGPDPSNGLEGVIVAQDIKPENLQYTQPKAQENPLVVYVERVVARLDQTFAPQSPVSELEPIVINEGQENEYTIYPTGFFFTSEDVDFTPGGTQTPEYDNEAIYAKFLGWAVTSTPNKSNLLKHITSAWGDADAIFGTINEPWYLTQYHRSFWGINPQAITADASDPDGSYIWYNYNELIGSATPEQGECFDMKTTRAYMQENANPYDGFETAANAKYPTKVIYAAQLVDSEGNEVTVAEWNGVYFTLTGIKELAASMLQMYYISGYENDDPSKPLYSPIQPDQITFITRRAYQNASTAIFSEPGSYYVYPTLTSSTAEGADEITNAAGLAWYHHANDGSDNYTLINANQLNSYMYDTFGVSKIWDKGQTYYYYEINHLGAEDSPGYYGVVRNHIYNANIKLLKGLGTPVWDPTEDIYPEKPTPEGNNISAEVKVLMWRMVSQDVEFDW